MIVTIPKNNVEVDMNVHTVSWEWIRDKRVQGANN